VRAAGKFRDELWPLRGFLDFELQFRCPCAQAGRALVLVILLLLPLDTSSRVNAYDG
jgi:hypothetical protein